MSSPGFSSFRSLMDAWDLHLIEQQMKDKVETLVNSGYYSLLIKKGKEIFGVSEEDRITFARMKDPQKNDEDGWVDDTSFMGTNLTNVVQGSPSETIFDKKDLKDLKVIDSDKAIGILTKQAQKKKEASPTTISIITKS